MGMLVEGKWQDVWYSTKEHGGRFKRQDSSFRGVISSGSRFTPDNDRYRLYVSHACPWANRTMIVRALKGLEDVIPVSVVHPDMLEQGWTFSPGPGVVPDPVFGATLLHEIYTATKPDYTGRVTVPVLFDTQEKTIVNNESSEIIRLLDQAFPQADSTYSFYPEHLQNKIDEINAWVYPLINNGVYKAGFATTQAAYEEAVEGVFEGLDRAESILESSRYLTGETLTEADVRLFTTLVRFDPVYHGHFKCNRKRIVDYPELWRFTKDIYALPKVAGTIHMDHITRHYYFSHRSINPHGIVPVGPKNWVA